MCMRMMVTVTIRGCWCKGCSDVVMWMLMTRWMIAGCGNGDLGGDMVVTMMGDDDCD